MVKSLMGWGLFGTAMQIRDSKIAGEKWNEIKIGNKTIDVYRRNLQLAYLDRISYLMSNEQGSTPSWARNYVTSVKVSQSDIRTVAANQLIELRKDLKKHKNKSDKMTKMHLEMVQNKISSILLGKPI